MIKLAKHILYFEEDIEDFYLHSIMFFIVAKDILRERNSKSHFEFELWDFGPANREIAKISSKESIKGEYYNDLYNIDNEILEWLSIDGYLIADLFQKTTFWKENYQKAIAEREIVYYNKKEIVKSYLEVKEMIDDRL